MSLEGSWLVESLAVGGELVPPLAAGKSLTLEVVDGRVSGSAGVNRFMGTLGSEKPFAQLATTMMTGPDELMSQERILLTHFESVDSVETSESGILLLSDGLIVVTLIPMGTDDVSAAS